MDRVQVSAVGKRYALGERSTARERISSLGRRLWPRPELTPHELWSLRDVSFNLGEGEALGILGRNGAGKSTLLKILTGITAPTTGCARVRGRVASLLEVGTGFHGELTGRENVYLNGAILGMSRREIARRFDEIVNFSGTARFIDTAVKKYSSGMYLRLAFSVAAHLEPDILIVDEVLAVGDAEFQRKCLRRMHEAEQEGRTLIFVSHDLESLISLCPRAILLEGGRVVRAGNSRDVARYYLTEATRQESAAAFASAGPITVRSAEVQALAGGPALFAGEPLRIRVEVSLAEQIPGLDMAITLDAQNGVRVFDELMSDGGIERLGSGDYVVEVRVPPLLNAGEYTAGVWFGTAFEEILDEPRLMPFMLAGGDPNRSTRLLTLNLAFDVTRVGVRRDS